MAGYPGAGTTGVLSRDGPTQGTSGARYALMAPESLKNNSSIAHRFAHPNC